MYYKDIISVENLLKAWREFERGKKNKKDVSDFSLKLSKNIFDLHNDLASKRYKHGTYESFKINDPKPRDIHKAKVRDRLLHHAIYRILYPYIDKKFIYDSYSCRNFKGTHRAMIRLSKFFLKASKNNTKTCYVLKCDIRKFFASIDQEILLKILRKYITDADIISLIKIVVDSFESTEKGKGLPLGNLTSQLLVNIYMNEFDQWMKHNLKIKWYARYADDFVILSRDKNQLIELIPKIAGFLDEHLKLRLHPEKVYTKTFSSGVDFLGWVHFPDCRTLRTTTKKRMFKKLKVSEENRDVLQSYLGLLSHGNTWKIREKVFGNVSLIHEAST
jgi:RNA-directed DNA polymerase